MSYGILSFLKDNIDVYIYCHNTDVDVTVADKNRNIVLNMNNRSVNNYFGSTTDILKTTAYKGNGMKLLKNKRK